MTQSHVYLVKANDLLVSHCRCAVAPVTFPPQMDCTWCGCGWLLTCINCRKAFTFAKAVLIEEPWPQIGRRDIVNQSGMEPESAKIAIWVGAMKELLANVVPNEEYVYLDGRIISVKAREVRFSGWHSQHDLSHVPQVTALRDPSVMNKILADRGYWEQHANPREN